jgi:hypothetical protein
VEVDRPRKTPVVFYMTPAGRAVVLDWLKGLANSDRASIGQDLMRVQFRWPVGMPLCRPLGDGLWEVRSNCPGNRIARLLFSFVDGKIVVLHGSSRKRNRRPTMI